MAFPGIIPQNASGADPLTIGSVTFLDEECPDDLSFDLAQQLSVHVYIGGARVIQALGPNPTDVTWSGKLFAGNVLVRIAALKAMEVAATPVSLSYLDQSYSVVVRKFTTKYLHRYEAEYTLVVTVLADTSGQYNQNPPPGIDGQVDGISAAAEATLEELAAEDAIGSELIQAQFAILFEELEIAGILSQLTGNALQNLILLAGNAYNACNEYTGGSGANGNSPQFILASRLASYASLIIKNLQAGQSPAVVVVQGGTSDLFDVASQQYGDPSLAFPLAAANGLNSPLLSSGETYQIVIPPLGAAA